MTPVPKNSNPSPVGNMLRSLRKASFAALNSCGISAAVAGSQWRQRRLLILCYHGISVEDEHEWLPRTYMPASALRGRFQLLRDTGCSVLPLGEALQRLYAGNLPPKSIAITFDDGGFDFYCSAYPIVREYGFPVTVYQTTYYSDFPKPIFNLACSYMLWKCRDKVFPAQPDLGITQPMDLRTPRGRESALIELLSATEKKGVNGAGKDELAQKLAQHLGFDYAAFYAKRLLQLMTPEEIAELSAKDIDFQLHTHRHRTPDDQELFRKEIRDNRKRLREITGQDARHFCYPSGVYKMQNLPWLAQEGVTSATTCEPHLASTASNALLLPRLVDTTFKSAIEFEAWLSGLGSLFARKPASASLNHRR
jgi:peptidoglycan/xylan/chitin deacetylase (PgdA/CDA1 family)